MTKTKTTLFELPPALQNTSVRVSLEQTILAILQEISVHLSLSVCIWVYDGFEPTALAFTLARCHPTAEQVEEEHLPELAAPIAAVPPMYFRSEPTLFRFMTAQQRASGGSSFQTSADGCVSRA